MFGAKNKLHDRVRVAIGQVEEAMKSAGVWETPEPTAEQVANGGAFGTSSMAFEQWLRWVFVPRVHQILDEKGEFPKSSQVADQAFREWKMWGDAPNVDGLIARLREFDALFN